MKPRTRIRVDERPKVHASHVTLLASFRSIRDIDSCAPWLWRKLEEEGLLELALAERQAHQRKRADERR